MTDDLDRCSRCGGPQLVNGGILLERGRISVCPKCKGDEMDEMRATLTATTQAAVALGVSINAFAKRVALKEDVPRDANLNPWLGGGVP